VDPKVLCSDQKTLSGLRRGHDTVDAVDLRTRQPDRPPRVNVEVQVVVVDPHGGVVAAVTSEDTHSHVSDEYATCGSDPLLDSG